MTSETPDPLLSRIQRAQQSPRGLTGRAVERA
jgi:hypothetical protein